MSTLNELTIKYERLKEQKLNILKELHICEHELKHYKQNQKTELNAKIKELKANEKNSCNILLSKQKIKYLYSLQDSSYSVDRKDKIQSLESELLLTK